MAGFCAHGNGSLAPIVERNFFCSRKNFLYDSATQKFTNQNLKKDNLANTFSEGKNINLFQAKNINLIEDWFLLTQKRRFNNSHCTLSKERGKLY